MTTNQQIIQPQSFNYQQGLEQLRFQKQQAVQREQDDLRRTREREIYNSRITKPIQTTPSQPAVPLYDALKIGYLRDAKKQQDQIGKYGYFVDKDNSNYDHMTAYNPTTNKLLYVVNGTDPTRIQDLYTDANLFLGGIKSTQRFKSDKRTYDKLKEEYDPKKIDIVGHSLGGTISNELERNNKNVNIKTFNSAAPILDKMFSKQNPIATNYRTKHDLVSSFKGNTITIDKNHNDLASLLIKPLRHQLEVHAVKNLKHHENIFV